MVEKFFVKGMNISEKKFNDGNLIIKLGIKIEELIDYLLPLKTQSEWANIDIKKGKSGKWYAELNTYKSSNTNEQQELILDETILDEEIPF